MTRLMQASGLDLLNVSMGFSTMDASVPWGPAFLAPVSARVRREAGLPVASGWCMDVPADAERAITEEQTDLVMIGRAHLANPHWPYQTALHLKQPQPSHVLPTPYTYWLERYEKGGAQ